MMTVAKSRRMWTYAAVCVVCSTLLAGCSSGTNAGPTAVTPTNASSETHQHDHQSHAANGDLRETTASLSVLPSFLDELPNQTYLAYKAAAMVRDTLAYIPCYCGCGGSAGHQSNLNCFIAEVRDDGTVVWDDHGTRCNVCTEIALSTAIMLQEGKTAKEIRAAIDEQYREGYAEPTPTPMPA